MTLASKRKMSQRQKRTRLTCSTQTDELGHNSVTNSPKSVRFTSVNDDMSPSVSLHEDASNGGEFYEEPSALYERLLKAEEVIFMGLLQHNEQILCRRCSFCSLFTKAGRINETIQDFI